MRTLGLEAAALQCMLERATALYPQEACGLLVGRAGRVEQALTCLNRATDRRQGYLIDPEDYLHIEQQVANAGRQVVGAWHSHPYGDAVPSETDRQLAWPGWHYLILGFRGRLPTQCRAWILNESVFEEEIIQP